MRILIKNWMNIRLQNFSWKIGRIAALILFRQGLRRRRIMMNRLGRRIIHFCRRLMRRWKLWGERSMNFMNHISMIKRWKNNIWVNSKSNKALGYPKSKLSITTTHLIWWTKLKKSLKIKNPGNPMKINKCSGKRWQSWWKRG